MLFKKVLKAKQTFLGHKILFLRIRMTICVKLNVDFFFCFLSLNVIAHMIVYLIDFIQIIAKGLCWKMT